MKFDNPSQRVYLSSSSFVEQSHIVTEVHLCSNDFRDVTKAS